MGVTLRAEPVHRASIDQSRKLVDSGDPASLTSEGIARDWIVAGRLGMFVT